MRRTQRNGDDKDDAAFFTGYEQEEGERDSRDRLPSRSKAWDSQPILHSPSPQLNTHSASSKNKVPVDSKEATRGKEEERREEATIIRRRQASTPASSVSIVPEDAKEAEGELELTLMDEVVLLGLKDKSGTLSFLNDSISYVLRGCILMELAFRDRIRLAPSASAMTGSRRWADRIVLAANPTLTGEVLLDEALKAIRQDAHQSISSWMDLLSGETWNPMKINYQLRQVRERIAKGLVDKGVLRTDRKSILGLVDIAVHPLADNRVKERLITRLIGALSETGGQSSAGSPAGLKTRATIAAAYAASVLDTALATKLRSAERDRLMRRAQEMLRPPPLASNASVAEQVMAGVLAVFSRLDNVMY